MKNIQLSTEATNNQRWQPTAYDDVEYRKACYLCFCYRISSLTTFCLKLYSSFEQSCWCPEWSWQSQTCHVSTLMLSPRTVPATSRLATHLNAKPIQAMEFSTENVCTRVQHGPIWLWLWTISRACYSDALLTWVRRRRRLRQILMKPAATTN